MNRSLSSLARQLAETWKQLGLNQRISIVLAGGVVFAGLIGLALWSSRVDYTLLYGRLDETEAARVVAALEEAKVPYKVGRGGGAILVPSDQVHPMRMQLATKGIPRGEGVGFEIFDRQSFGISDFVQRANYVRAIQGELARTIGQLDQVEGARVMIAMPENRLILNSQKKPTASVLVRVRGNSRLPTSSVDSIRLLVANSVEGMQASGVTVVDNLGNVLSGNDEEDSVAGLSATQLTARRDLEQYLSKKAEGMLDEVLGPGQAVVRVSAEINWDTVTKVEEKYDPEGQVVRSETINDESVDSNTSPGGGVPGVPSNVAGEGTNTTVSAAAAATTSRTKKKVTTNQYDLSKTTSNILQAAGGIKRVSAAVFVAARMTGSGTNRVMAPRTPEELTKLRRIVQSALGIQEGSVRSDELILEEISFNDQPAAELSRQIETQEQRRFWFELAQKLVYPAFAVGILFLFWRTFQRVKAPDVALGLPLGGYTGNGNGNGHGHAMPAKETVPGLVTAEVLNRMIRENPSSLNYAVRTWLDQGSEPKK